MKTSRFTRAWVLLTCGCLLLVGTLLTRTHAQTSQKKNDVQQELVQAEMGFFDAWKAKDISYFRSHIPENGIFWGQSGTLTREQQLEEQQASATSCKVEGYGLSDFRVLPLNAGAYLLTYKAEQYATCGEKLPVHINGSTVYIFQEGRWQAIYRAQVPMKNQS